MTFAGIKIATNSIARSIRQRESQSICVRKICRSMAIPCTTTKVANNGSSFGVESELTCHIRASPFAKSSSFSASLLFAGIAMTGGAGFTLCESQQDNRNADSSSLDATTTVPTPSSNQATTTRPLWPGGVQEQEIDALVDEILKDRTINIKAVPDAVERRIYKSTILLTLNVFYHLLHSLNGVPLLAHELRLSRRRDADDHNSESTSVTKTIQAQTEMINDAVLEQVADRLLSNKAINSKLIPDVMERQLYINCLKVVFRVLSIVLSSLSIRLCGHDLRILLTPDTMTPVNNASSATLSLEQSALKVSSSLTKIDLERVRQFALDSGIDESSNVPLHWWDALFVKQDLVAHLHASLYGLLLGILDDILANTKVEILSDEIGIDIVPSSPESLAARLAHPADSVDVGDGEERGPSVGSFALASFAAGVGMGVTLMAVLSNNQR